MASDISKKILERYESEMLNTFNRESIFKVMDDNRMSQFRGFKYKLPWYLWPFKSRINGILFLSFKDGYSQDRSDTVKIKRPRRYT